MATNSRFLAMGLLLGLSALPAPGQQQPPAADAARSASSRFILKPASAPIPEPSASAAAKVESMSLLDDKRPLVAGDIVSYRVLQDNQPPVLLRVGDGGEIDVPLAGRVKAAGRTCRLFASDVKSALEHEYYKMATVIVGLESASAGSIGRIYITGQVLGQGQLDLMANEPLTVSKAIMQAGGFGEFANQRRVHLIRTMADGSTKTFTVDVKDILTKGHLEKDLSLKPGDIIVIPERAFNW